MNNFSADTSFYATERGFWAGRYYKIYANENGLHAAGLGVRDEENALAIAQVNGDDGNAWMAKRHLKKQRQREAEYDAMMEGLSGSGELAAHDKRNFSLYPTRWTRLELIPNAKIRSNPNCYATFVIQLSDGKDRKFGLVGNSSLQQVKAALSSWLPQETATSPNNEDDVAQNERTGSEQLRLAQESEAQAQGVTWIISILLCLGLSIKVCWQLQSFFGFFGLILIPKVHFWIHSLYSILFLSKDAVIQMRSKRKAK